MKDSKQFIYFFLLITMFACNSEETNQHEKSDRVTKKNENYLDNKSISFKEKVERSLKNEHISNVTLSNTQISNVHALYKTNGYRNIFESESGPSKMGIQLNDIIENTLQYGLCENRLLHYPDNAHWIEREIIATTNFTTIIGDLKNGFIDFEKMEFKQIHEVRFSQSFLDSIDLNDTLGLSNYVRNCSSKDTNYTYLSQNLFDFYNKFPLDTTSFILKKKNEDPENYSKNLTMALTSKGYLNDTTTKAFKSALRKFKQDCSFENSSIVTDAVLSALSESTESKFIRAAIALDKLRQQTPKEKKHIRVNLPSFMLYFIAEDEVQSSHRVIIGKNKTQTPEFSAKMNKIVSYPYWKVPQSISDNEILPAVKRKKTYLADKHYRIYQNNLEIDPETIDFSKYYKRFPFTTIQDPGADNSLGIIKFVFYNEHGVYFHDTPTKSLFKRDFRNFSHGCMRCENPVELGKKILDFDEISPGKQNEITSDSLDTYLLNEQHQEIKLKKRIPIYIEYISVTAEKNKIYFHNDLYAREQKLIDLFLKK